jgi:hypothetical protein
MKIFKLFLFIIPIFFVVCGFAMYQIIFVQKPAANLQIETVVTDLRQVNPVGKEVKGKINIPNELKSSQPAIKETEIKVETAPKPADPIVENVFERGGYSDQNNAYKI